MSVLSYTATRSRSQSPSRRRSSRPRGLEGAVYRVGFALVAWSRHRADRRVPTVESNELALARERMLRSRERDAVGSPLLTRRG